MYSYISMYMCTHHTCIHMYASYMYGLPISIYTLPMNTHIHIIIGLFCRIASLLSMYMCTHHTRIQSIPAPNYSIRWWSNFLRISAVRELLLRQCSMQTGSESFDSKPVADAAAAAGMYAHMHRNAHTHTHTRNTYIRTDYGVATISRLLKNKGVFCRIYSLL